MFLLITGASGTGKSSVRAELEPEVVCLELGDVVPIPPWPTIAWRQESTKAVVRLALEYQAEGRHPPPSLTWARASLRGETSQLEMRAGGAQNGQLSKT